jgi:phosphate transport system substrate-binding protein
MWSGKYLVQGLMAWGMGMLWISCGNKETATKTNIETTTSGTITISVDDTYKPVIAQQLKVFDSSYPEAHVTAHYKSEKACFEDLFSGTAKLIVTSRDLTEAERKAYIASGRKTRSLPVAMDAIAVIVHPNSPDTLMTLGQLQKILQAGFIRTYDIVFDNGESSTVRYITDSLIPGANLSSKAYAVKSLDSVISYVANKENAIGFVGVSNIYDPDDNTGVGVFKNNIRVVAFKDDSTGIFYQPYQAYIALRQYPLTRSMYFITTDNGRGLGAGFANFLCSERGQLIFGKARFAPLRVQLQIREAEIK